MAADPRRDVERETGLCTRRSGGPHWTENGPHTNCLLVLVPRRGVGSALDRERTPHQSDYLYSSPTAVAASWPAFRASSTEPLPATTEDRSFVTESPRVVNSGMSTN